MEKQKKIYQFKSSKLWIDSVTIGFAIFGVFSAIFGVLGVSFTDISDNVWIVLLATSASSVSYGKNGVLKNSYFSYYNRNIIKRGDGIA